MVVIIQYWFTMLSYTTTKTSFQLDKSINKVYKRVFKFIKAERADGLNNYITWSITVYGPQSTL